MRVGAAISAAYIVAMLAWAIAERSNVFAMKPNEFGDLLAGIFSPLAFLWLVLGYFQQGDELRASVAALKLQGKELSNSVAQQKALVEVSKRQLEAEFDARRSSERDKEYQAQPRFQSNREITQHSKSVRSFLFRFQNIGADCSDVQIACLGAIQSKLDHVRSGEQIDFGLECETDTLDGFDGYIEYLDALGLPKRQLFTVEATPPLFGTGQWKYEAPKISKEVLRPPFDEEARPSA